MWTLAIMTLRALPWVSTQGAASAPRSPPRKLEVALEIWCAVGRRRCEASPASPTTPQCSCMSVGAPKQRS